MKNIKHLFSLTLIFAATLGWTACGGEHKPGDGHDHATETPAAEGEHAEEAEHEEHAEGSLELTAEQIKNVGVEMGAFTRQNLSDVVKVNGELDVHSQHIATVSAFTDGIVTQMRVDLNAYVNKGAVVAILRKPDLIDLQQQYLEGKNQLVFAEQEFQRYKDLKEANATATKNFQKAESELRSLQTNLKAWEAKLRQMQIDPTTLTADNLKTSIVLTAPISGTITRLNANIGTALTVGTSVADIVDFSKIHTDFFVFEKDVQKVKVGQKISFNFPSNPQQVYRATVKGMDKALDPEKKALRIHADIERAGVVPVGGFTDGTYVEGRIEISGTGVEALPKEAVVKDGTQDFIIVVEEKEASGNIRFKKIPVTVGAMNDAFVEVKPLEALPGGTQIVLKGAFYVAAQGKVGEDGHGH
ncbi:MAG: efflux RND transporter periplasmic adaptor subunit [Saprospiraceae bacterium]|jgi:RND family efflux transporter MFP subunit|nr:efflux RND transporter periplasmic adaptor subunit [Saprospiraceae bacterium]